MARAHAPDRLAGADKTAHDVDVKHALEPRHTHLVHPRGHVHHTGIVDQGGERPQTGVDARKHGQHLRLIGHIGLHRHRRAAAGADLPHHLVGRQRVGAVIDSHGKAALRRQQRRGRANAAGGTGDEEGGCHM